MLCPYENEGRITNPELRRISRRRALGTVAAAATASLSLPTRSTWAVDSVFPERTDLDDLYDREVDLAVRRGLHLLLARQNSDGTFRSSEQGKWVGVCSLVGLALLSRGVRPGVGDAGRSLQRTAEYVLSKVQSSGFLSAKETSHGPMYDHGFGTLFLAELYGTAPLRGARKKLGKAVKLIVDIQNDAGGWRYNPNPEDADLSVTVSQMMALRAAKNAGFGVPKETIDRAVEYVRRSQNPDGGFMYQLKGGESGFPLTAAAVVALYSAGIYDGQELESAFGFLRENASASKRLGRDDFFYYAHYYSVQAFWHLGDDDWQGWFTTLKRSLLKLRNAEGGWFDFNSLEYGTAMACLILNMPRTVLPIFQR